ncbi:hypothetical protein ABBQ32_006746 [Trebouxia sp. C0010 RCD-2024]
MRTCSAVELPELERVHWLNSLVDQTWPHVNRVVSPILQQNIEKLISNNAPPWLSSAHLKRFDLGYNAPKVHGIRVYPVAGPDGEHLTVELEAEWHSLADIALTASFSAETILLGPIKSVVNLLSNLLPVTVGVKSVTLSGRFCIMTGPLLNQMPIVTFSKAGLVEQPYLHIDLVLFGASCTHLLAPLQAWINNLIGNKLKDLIVPESDNMPVVPDDFKQIRRPCGLLFVTDLRAANVPKMDYFSESDPYIKLFVMNPGQAVKDMKDTDCQKTTVKQDDPDPVWGEEEFRLPVFQPEQELTLQMWDWDLATADDEIGQGSLAIKDLMNGGTREVAVAIISPQSMADVKGVASGGAAIKPRNGQPCVVSCKVTYHAFGQYGDQLQSPDSYINSSITSSGASSEQGLSRTVSQPLGPHTGQGGALKPGRSAFENSESVVPGNGEQQRVFSEDGGTAVGRSRSWGCSVPWLRRSGSMEQHQFERKRSWRSSTMSAALPVEGLYGSNSQKENLGNTVSGYRAGKGTVGSQRALTDSARTSMSGQRCLSALDSGTSRDGQPLLLMPSKEPRRHFGRSNTDSSLPGPSRNDSAALERASTAVFMESTKAATFQGGMLYVKVRRISQLIDPDRGTRDHTVERALPQRMTVNVTVAKEVKSVVVATDKNAPADQILEFLVCHKEDVGMVELEVRDLRLGAFQGHVSIPFEGVVQRKRIRDDFPVQGATNSQLKLSLSLAWSGSH